MLADKEAVATVAVKDLGAARRFYEDKLGLKPVQEEGGSVVTYQTGGSSLVVYASQFAGTNQATSATWSVGEDFDQIVRALQENLERYESAYGAIQEATDPAPAGGVH